MAIDSQSVYREEVFSRINEKRNSVVRTKINVKMSDSKSDDRKLISYNCFYKYLKNEVSAQLLKVSDM